jgi:GMP synthase (glutamine-hydrolysing)
MGGLARPGPRDALHVHFIQHESYEAPGAFESWVHDRGHFSTYSRVYQGQALPECESDIDVLVVLGGPQSPTTSTAECAHFDSAAECDLIRSCIAAGKVVVGVCLGAQLIGHSLGADAAPSPYPEIGNFPITLTAAGQADDKVAHFGPGLVVGHWHNDMPGLTADATVLAVSRGCPRQIVEYGELVYGLQCHLEFTAAVVEQLIAHTEPQLFEPSTILVQQPDALRSYDYGAMNQMLHAFLDKLAAAYLSVGTRCT